jgi:HEAT repeat protein
MKKSILKLIIAALAVTSLVAQQRFGRERLMKDLAAFTLPDWQQREAAFYDVVYHADPDVDAQVDTRYAEEDSTTYLLRTLAPADRELFKKSLIQLLITESAFEQTGAVSDEELSVYVEDIAMAVMIMRDPQSIPALLGIIKHLAPIQAVAAFGEPAVQPALNKLARTPTTVNTQDEELRMDLAMLFDAFLRPPNAAKVRSESVTKLKNALRQLAADPSGIVRVNAVEGLVRFQDDPEIKALLTHLAQNDPEISTTPDGRQCYQVRQAARAALTSH